MEKITINGIRVWYDPEDCENCRMDIVTCQKIAEYLKEALKGAKPLKVYNERRVEEKSRGTVPWDEAYERRSRPHNYE